MTKPDRRGRFGRWLEGEQPLFDEERSVLLDFDGLEPDQPQKRRPRRRRTGAILSRHYKFYRFLAVCACITMMVLLMFSIYQDTIQPYFTLPFRNLEAAIHSKPYQHITVIDTHRPPLWALVRLFHTITDTLNKPGLFR